MLTGACSCWSVSCFSGCLVSIWGQSSRGRADHRAAEGHRAKGPELRRQILCRFRKCLFIVRVCLLAFIHVCGPVPVWWCHPVSIIDSSWFIFSALPVVFDSCRLLRWHGVIQLGKHNRSQTLGQDWWGAFWSGGRHLKERHSFI